MKKFLLFLSLTTAFPALAQAEGFEFSQSGLAGQYYGIMETKKHDNLDNMPNRLVTRIDGAVSGLYRFADDSTLGAYANYTFVYRQHDKDYNDGDWRFYPYLQGESKQLGRLSIGYTYGAAFQLHQGAQEITWLGIQDSNLPYFLPSANWTNGLKSVGFATPKSTSILDDGRALKFSYFTPQIYNTVFGFSYTPDNANRRGMVSRYVNYHGPQDGYSAGMKNTWNLGEDNNLYTSVSYGQFNGDDKEWAFGTRWVYQKFNIGTSYKKAYIDGDKNPITEKSTNPHLPDFFDNYREGEAWDFSVGYDFGRIKTNLAYLHTEAENTRHSDDLIIQSNIFEINEYFNFYAINAYINSKGDKRDSDDNNKGYAFITGLAVKY